MHFLMSLASGRVLRFCAFAGFLMTLIACSKTEAPLEPLRSVKLITVAGSDLTGDGTFSAEVRARVVPDEGDPAGEGRMVQLRELHGALDDVQRAWIAALADQSRQVASFHLAERKTTRTTRIVRGLIVLAANDCMDDDLVRAAAAFALDSDEPLHPSLPAGAAIAALGWIEAGTFLAACEAFVAGGMAIDIDDTGVMRLIDKPLTEAEAAARLGALPA